MSEQFPFSDPIQKKIAAWILSTDEEFLDTAESITPEMFDNPAVSDIMVIVYAFHGKYNRLPDLDELTTEFETFLESKKKLPVDEYLTVYQEVTSMVDSADFSYVKDKAVEFARYQGIKAAMAESADIIRKKKNYNDILEKVRVALAIGENSKDLGTLYYEDLEKRLEDRRSGITRAQLAISTGIQHLDYILGGGLAPGELGVILGFAKKGKTTLSVNLGANAVWNQKNVAHYIMEGTPTDITDNYDCLISGIPRDQLRAHEDEVRERVEAHRADAANGRLVIKHFPALTCNTLAIENHLARMRAREKFIPALVIVDYLTLMITNGRWVSRPGERYEVLGQICKELISLAQRYHVPVWLLHQATRGAKKKHTVDLDDSADSLEPMRDADMILTLNQDIEEAKVKKLRIFLAGGRKAKDRRTAHVIIERELCHIIGERVSDEDAIAADVEATPDPEVK